MRLATQGALRAASLATVLGAAVAVSACGSGSATAPVLPSAVVPSPPVTTASPPVAAATPGPTLAMPSGATVTLDASLLALLPASVGGLPINQEPESFAEAVKDPSFVASVDRAVFALAVGGAADSAASATTDLLSGVVAHLRPGVWSGKWFSDWRSSYDEGACAQAGGGVAHAESTVGGRTIYVTTCSQGLRVYHTYLPTAGVVVSMLSLGQGDLGLELMQQLHD